MNSSNTTAYEHILDALRAHGSKVTENSNCTKATATCPAHDDINPSLTVSMGRDQPVVVHCHAGCRAEDVLAALDLTLADLSASRARRDDGEQIKGSPIIARYDYRDENGEVLFQVVRSANKGFLQRRPDPTAKGRWQWGLGGDTRRVLYRLPKVISEAGRSGWIWLVEGEKDVHTLEAAGLVATCNPGGAGKWRDEYAEALRGVGAVTIVADRDEPGRAHAARVRASLIAAGITDVEVKEAASGKDVTDHLTAGHSLADLIEAGSSGEPAPPPQDQPPPAPGDLIFRTLADVAREVDARPPRTYLFEPVWPDGDYGVASAEDKAGKTWGGLDAAVSAAAGLPWLGIYPCRTAGPVVMFLGEGSDAKILRRIRAVAAAKGLTREQADALPIVLCFRAPTLSDAGHLRQIAAQLKAVRPVLTILDPLYLAAHGANGADLYAMGAMLGSVQRIAQEHGSSLLIAHHWNKTGTGSGHNRSSGVGPTAWGRVLISVAVKKAQTDPITKETTVTLKWSFKGDEIPDTDQVLVRRVWADDPADLNSPLHYAITPGTDEKDGGAADPAASLQPSVRTVLRVLRAATAPLSVSDIGDVLAVEEEHTEMRPLKARTIQNAIKILVDASMIVKAGEPAGIAAYAAADPLEAE